MYHISDDARSKKSADAIVKSVIRLCQEKNLSEISVSDIWRDSSVSRSTYYRLFDTLDDVLQYACDNLLPSSQNKSTYALDADVQKIVLEYIQIMLTNNSLLYALQQNDRMHLLGQTHKNNLKEIMSLIGVYEYNEKDAIYLFNILSGCLMGAMNGWTQNGMKDSPEEILAYFKTSFQAIQTFLNK